MDIRSYLESKGLGPLKRANDLNVRINCFFCGEDPSKRGRLYINVDPSAEIEGLFFCHLCGTKGSLTTIKRHFGDPVTSAEDTSWERRQILAKSCGYYQNLLMKTPEVLEWLHSERGLTDETIIKHKLGWADGGLRDHLKDYSLGSMKETGLINESGNDFFRNHITIPYLINGNVVMLRGKEMGGKYLTPPGQKTRLYNSDVIWSTENLLVAEGEMDSLILEQMGFDAVGVPGANVWQQAWNGMFESIKRVYVMFDPDEAGRIGAAKVKDNLGPKVRVVDLPVPEDMDPKEVDPSSLVVQGGFDSDSFTKLLQGASGGVLKSISAVVARHKEMELVSGLKFGIDTLDSVISPGLLPTQVFTLLARSGTGKSVMLLNMAHRMAMVQPDIKFMLVSLELTDWQCWERMKRIHRFYNLTASDQQAIDFWQSRMLVADPNRMSDMGLKDAINDFSYEMGARPDVIMVDYLGYFARAFKGESYSQTTNAMFFLKELAKEEELVIITPQQLNRSAEPGCEPSPDDARSSGSVLEQSDFMTLLWNPDEKLGTKVEERQGEVHGRLSKSRHGGAGTLLRFQFAPLTLAMVPMEDPLRRRAQCELDRLISEDRRLEMNLRSERVTWEEMVDLHLEREAVSSSLPFIDDF